MYIGLDDGT